MGEKRAKRQTDSEFLSPKEAAVLLDMKLYKLYQEIEAGNIPFKLPAGHVRRGMLLPRDAIATLIRRRRLLQKATQRTAHYQFAPSTTADVYIAVKNAQQVYGEEDSISFERALEWRDLNPEISMSVKDGKQLAGMVTLLPLEEEVIHALLNDKMREKDIPDVAIRQWTDPSLSVYIAGVAIVSTGERVQDSLRGRFLLDHTLRWSITLSSIYSIKKWYGIGVSQYGQRLMQQLDFQEIVSLEQGERKGYVFDMYRANDVRLLQRFRARMEQQ